MAPGPLIRREFASPGMVLIKHLFSFTDRKKLPPAVPDAAVVLGAT